MNARQFSLKLALFFAPLVALYSVPLAVMVPSGEIRTADAIAEAHAKGPPEAIYGPAYTNPDRRYKLVSFQQHDAPIVAIGSSRAMQFRSAFFKDGENAFYNAGGVAGRIFHLRRFLSHVPEASRSKHWLVSLDQWWFNDADEGSHDDPGVDAYFEEQTDMLGNLRLGLTAWSDVRARKVSLPKLLEGTPHWGVSAAMRGSGWRRDGSYAYPVYRDPGAAHDVGFADTLAHLKHKRHHFEPADRPVARALAETRKFVDACRERNISVVLFLPPYTPTIEHLVRESPDYVYLQKLADEIREALRGTDVKLYDFTSCEGDLGCVDAEFVDGVHGGDTVYGRITRMMARDVPWLAEALAPTLPERLAGTQGKATIGP